MADHNSGLQCTLKLGEETYEISVNPSTGICTVIQREVLHVEWLPMSNIMSFGLGQMTDVYFVYYYRGQITQASDGTYSCRFQGRYTDFHIDNLSQATIEAIRKHAWENIYIADWQESWLTRAECEFWDALLDGYIASDPRKPLDLLQISGNPDEEYPVACLAFYYEALSYANREIEISLEGIRDVYHNSPEYHFYYEYNHDGLLLANGNWNYTGYYYREEYDDQRRPISSVIYNADGSGYETYWDWQPDRLVRTSYEYGFVKETIEIVLRSRTVEILLYNPETEMYDKWVSSHTYDENDQLIKCFLYNEDGQLIEFYQNTDGTIRRELYTYENGLKVREQHWDNEILLTDIEFFYEDGRLIQEIRTDFFGSVTTVDYIYEGNDLVKRIITITHPDGTSDRHEEDVPKPDIPAPAP